MAQYEGPRFTQPDDLDNESPARREAVSGRREDIHIRNYDFRQGYDLEIAVVTESGEVALEDRYYLAPGDYRSLDDVIGPGRYRVTVQLDGKKSAATRCDVDDGPKGGILVELGNGQVSVTDGIYV